jgi:septal ring factor EnvC (AmiA/AmiB activator)
MRYTGTKFTEQEAEQIMRETRVRLAEKPKPRADGMRRRDHGADVVYKTNADAHEPAAEVSVADAQTSWAEWVDARVYGLLEVMRDAVAEHLESELNVIRQDVAQLRKQVEVEIKLDHRIASLNAEVAKARSQAPDFKSDLSDLQEDVEKLQRSVGVLRARNSTLEFQQAQIKADQRQNKEKVTLTAVQLTSIGSQTREVMQRLRDSGFDLSAEMLS